MKTLKEIQALELIGEEIFLNEDVNESNPVSVFAEGTDTFEDPIRIYTVDTMGAIKVFGLTKPQSKIEVENRDEILKYSLGRWTPEDEVSLKDIFIQGEFVTEITNYLKLPLFTYEKNIKKFGHSVSGMSMYNVLDQKGKSIPFLVGLDYCDAEFYVDSINMKNTKGHRMIEVLDYLVK
jgi:hypothetical protein